MHVRTVLRTLAACRTPQMGGSLLECDWCGRQEYHFHSCGDRHCPTCNGSARAKWLEQRQAELLPTTYYHVVFTLPSQLRDLTYCNQASLYAVLLRTAGRTLTELCQAENHLGATPGVMTVLHTWGGSLAFHPHAHCVVTGGGLTKDRARWVACRGGGNFFLPIRALSRKFRGKFLAELKKLHAAGELTFPPKLAYLADPKRFRVWLKPLYRKHWHAYAKPPFGGPERVLKYLARYSHGVAISNKRLLELEHDRVTFECKNAAAPGGTETLTLDADEFVRRFVQHVLPKRFTRIRYFGLLGNRYRRENLTRCRELLASESAPEVPVPDNSPSPDERSKDRCPSCRQGNLILTASWPRPTRQELLEHPSPWSPSLPPGRTRKAACLDVRASSAPGHPP